MDVDVNAIEKAHQLVRRATAFVFCLMALAFSLAHPLQDPGHGAMAAAALVMGIVFVVIANKLYARHLKFKVELPERELSQFMMAWFTGWAAVGYGVGQFL